jgi:hypothetical protein
MKWKYASRCREIIACSICTAVISVVGVVDLFVVVEFIVSGCSIATDDFLVHRLDVTRVAEFGTWELYGNASSSQSVSGVLCGVGSIAPM